MKKDYPLIYSADDLARDELSKLPEGEQTEENYWKLYRKHEKKYNKLFRKFYRK